MSDGLFDETSAAGLAQAAEERTLAHLRRAEAVAKIIADAQAAVAALRAEVGTIASGLGVSHRWSGTLLQLLAPGGVYGEAVDLVGPRGPAGPMPTFIVGSVATGDSPSLTFSPDPSVPGRFILDAVFVRGQKGDKGDTPDLDDLDLSELTLDWARITGKPIFFSGAYADLTGKPALFSGAYADLAGLPTLGTVAALNAGAAAGNVPVLDAGGKLLASILPALAISDIFEVGSQAAMLALTAQTGDIAIRTDLNRTFALAAEPASTLANWKELRTPTDTVLSVAGLTGTITAAALKTALAIVAADITDATAAGRGVLTAASYAAITALLSVFVADTGSAAGTKGLVPAPAAGDGAAGKFLRANGAWEVPASGLFPNGERAISATGTITAADKGKVLVIAATAGATITLTLDTAANLGAGFFCGIRRADGVVASVTLAAAAGETIEGRASIRVHQEDFALRYSGAGATRTAFRARQVVVGSAALTGVSLSTVSLTEGFSDPEITAVDLDFENWNNGGASRTLRHIKSGAPVTAASYNYATVSTTQGTPATALASGDTLTANINLGQGAGNAGGSLRFHGIKAAVARQQIVEIRIHETSGDRAYTTSGTGQDQVAATLDGIQLFGGTITSITYTLKAVRG